MERVANDNEKSDAPVSGQDVVAAYQRGYQLGRDGKMSEHQNEKVDVLRRVHSEGHFKGFYKDGFPGSEF